MMKLLCITCNKIIDQGIEMIIILFTFFIFIEIVF